MYVLHIYVLFYIRFILYMFYTIYLLHYIHFTQLHYIYCIRSYIIKKISTQVYNIQCSLNNVCYESIILNIQLYHDKPNLLG